MSKIILQPCSNSDTPKHYQDTVSNNVSLHFVSNFVPQKEYDLLKETYPNGSCQIWGVTPNKNGISGWQKICAGDFALFSGRGIVFSSGIATFKLQSSSLAEALWGFDNSGTTWEYIYFLDEI